MNAMIQKLRRFGRDTSGSSTIEFVILFPAFIFVLLSTIESGILMFHNVMLDRGVDIAVRELRLGTNPTITEDQFRRSVCNEAAFLPDCTNAVRIELSRIDPDTFVMPQTAATCMERNEPVQPLTSFTPGVGHELMLVRVCAVFDPFFPTTGLGLRMPKDASGAYALTTASAFVVEP